MNAFSLLPQAIEAIAKEATGLLACRMELLKLSCSRTIFIPLQHSPLLLYFPLVLFFTNFISSFTSQTPRSYLCRDPEQGCQLYKSWMGVQTQPGMTGSKSKIWIRIYPNDGIIPKNNPATRQLSAACMEAFSWLNNGLQRCLVLVATICECSLIGKKIHCRYDQLKARDEEVELLGSQMSL